MSRSTLSLKFFKLKDNLLQPVRRAIIKETPLYLSINGTPYQTLMRTPGQEKELILGFCVTEGLLPPHPLILPFDEKEIGLIGNTLNLSLPDYSLSSSRFFNPAAHNPPGQITQEDRLLKEMARTLPAMDNNLTISLKTLQIIESKMKKKQKLFSRTGGTHAASLFSQHGRYICCAEDIARHNALDKVIGYALLHKLNLTDKILCLSGRTNIELIMKAARCHIPIVASISAPSSFSIKMARLTKMTLIGFLRNKEMNIYSGYFRIKEIGHGSKSQN